MYSVHPIRIPSALKRPSKKPFYVYGIHQGDIVMVWVILLQNAHMLTVTSVEKTTKSITVHDYMSHPLHVHIIILHSTHTNACHKIKNSNKTTTKIETKHKNKHHLVTSFMEPQHKSRKTNKIQHHPTYSWFSCKYFKTK